jgi:hypothetical protein
VPRAKPWRGWKRPARAAVCLTDEQRGRLRCCGPPRCARWRSALPAVEEIARGAIARARDDYPKPAEMRAAMKILRGRISAARAAIADSDEWTKGRINIADNAGHHRSRNFVVNSADDQLARFEAAIDAAEVKLAGGKKPRPGLFALDVAMRLRDVFQVFGMQFDRTKGSRAPETLYVILNFITPTGLDAADHHMREVEKLGE